VAQATDVAAISILARRIVPRSFYSDHLASLAFAAYEGDVQRVLVFCFRFSVRINCLFCHLERWTLVLFWWGFITGLGEASIDVAWFMILRTLLYSETDVNKARVSRVTIRQAL
jgi:hypothetical protein